MIAQKLIRVLVADDSQVVQHLLRELIDAEPDMIVVGTAATGRETVDKLARLRPDLVTVDVTMPDGDGISATRRIMATRPTPTVIVTAAPVGPASNVSFEALAAGAVEVLPKPSHSVLDDAAARAAFVRELRLAAGVGVVGIRQRRATPSSRPPTPVPVSVSVSDDLPSHYDLVPSTAALIAIGASTGGPPCVRSVLQDLRPEHTPPIALVQHMSIEFLPSFVSWLDDALALRVQLVARRVLPEPGCVYVAPGDSHLEAVGDGELALSDTAPERHQRPAVDVLFRSVARVYGAHAVGVLLTGMGEDGAQGLQCMHEAGALTVAQDEKSCVVYGMPKAAIERNAVDLTAGPLAIARVLGRVRTSVSRPPRHGRIS